MNQVRTAAIGLGARGYSMLHALLLHMDNVRITAVCDLYEDRLNRAADAVEKVYGEGNRPFASTDYKEVLDRDDVDAVLIMSAWESHFPIAIYAMERGIAVGMEVGGAYSIDDCWQLVRTYERTKTPFMLLENCCYGEAEMSVMHMVKLGLFGDVVHCEGGYRHDLRDEIIFGKDESETKTIEYVVLFSGVVYTAYCIFSIRAVYSLLDF